MEIMSATRSVLDTVAANLVMGVINVDVRQILQRAHLVLGHRALTADVQDRAFGTKSRGDAGDGIRASGSGGRDHAAKLAGLARIAVGCVRGDLFVAHVDDADALIDAAVIDVDDVASAEREYRVDTLVLQRLGDQVAAGDHARVAALALQGIFGGRRLRLNRCRNYSCHIFLHKIANASRRLEPAQKPSHSTTRARLSASIDADPLCRLPDLRPARRQPPGRACAGASAIARTIASTAAKIGSAPAIHSTGTQLPAECLSTFASGISSDAAPLAVYSRPLLVAAYFGPKVSPLSRGEQARNLAVDPGRYSGAKMQEARRVGMTELHQAPEAEALDGKYQHHRVLAADMVGNPAEERPRQAVEDC